MNTPPKILGGLIVGAALGAGVILVAGADGPEVSLPAPPADVVPAPAGPPERFLSDRIEGDPRLAAVLRDVPADSIAERWRAHDIWRRDFRYNRQRLELSLVRVRADDDEVEGDPAAERWRVADDVLDVRSGTRIPADEALARFGR